MFNKAPNRKNMRKRAKEDDEEEGDQAGSAVVRKEKKQAGGALSATTAGARKKAEDAFYESARTVVPTIGRDNNAVTVDEEEEQELPAGAGGGEAKDGTYKGVANYQKFIEKRDVMDRKASSIGPIKAPSNVRLTCRFDFQPDLCKDYKETGYCTFGDACKFMHDRGDYKQGWELDRDWEAEQEKKRMDAALEEMEGEKGPKKEEEIDDGLPFACAICRGPFKQPVETKCGHYFCEGCALAHYAKNRRCFICNEQTFGSFNGATKLVAKIQRLKGGKGGTAASKAKEEEQDDSEIAGSGWTETKFKAEQGWAIPGNTFTQGKEV